MQTYAGQVAIMLAEQFYTVESIKTWWSLSVQWTGTEWKRALGMGSKSFETMTELTAFLGFLFLFFSASNDTPW